mmetsp:Transcript_51658/g.122968  ORF Transcript_51658/g.122968 Transcript_51658/m.122968 type:complete len:232 (-) Transcript_51658:1103-1798(-)
MVKAPSKPPSAPCMSSGPTDGTNTFRAWAIATMLNVKRAKNVETSCLKTRIMMITSTPKYSQGRSSTAAAIHAKLVPKESAMAVLLSTPPSLAQYSITWIVSATSPIQPMTSKAVTGMRTSSTALSPVMRLILDSNAFQSSSKIHFDGLFSSSRSVLNMSAFLCRATNPEITSIAKPPHWSKQSRNKMISNNANVAAVSSFEDVSSCAVTWRSVSNVRTSNLAMYIKTPSM